MQLHAATTVDGRDRRRLERVCRYLLRPPFAHDAIGVPLGVATGSLSAGSTTYAIGKVFTAHYGTGGTLFDFDPEKLRDYFHCQSSAGREVSRR